MGINIINGDNNDNTLTGTNGRDMIFGYDGNDTINGRGGNDKIYDGFGDDIVKGGAGNDMLFLGLGGGNDDIDGGSGIDTLVVDLSGQTPRQFVVFWNMKSGDFGATHTTYGRDIIRNVENFKLIGTYDVQIAGDNSKNVIKTDAGNDTLKGGGGNDTIKSGGGKDTLFGGKGNDKLTGGAGKDVFVFKKKEGKDTITDFENGKDKIDLSAFNFNNKAQALAKFYEIGSGSNDKLGFKFKGTEIIVKGIDMGDLNGADLII